MMEIAAYFIGLVFGLAVCSPFLYEYGRQLRAARERIGRTRDDLLAINYSINTLKDIGGIQAAEIRRLKQDVALAEADVSLRDIRLEETRGVVRRWMDRMIALRVEASRLGRDLEETRRALDLSIANERSMAQRLADVRKDHDKMTRIYNDLVDNATRTAGSIMGHAREINSIRRDGFRADPAIPSAAEFDKVMRKHHHSLAAISGEAGSIEGLAENIRKLCRRGTGGELGGVGTYPAVAPPPDRLVGPLDNMLSEVGRRLEKGPRSRGGR